MKWKNTKVTELIGGSLSSNLVVVARAVNNNAEVLKEAVQKIEELSEKHTNKEIARHFGRERKFVTNMKCGCCFHMNPEFIAGLREYGYELKLVKIGSDEE